MHFRVESLKEWRVVDIENLAFTGTPRIKSIFMRIYTLNQVKKQTNRGAPVKAMFSTCLKSDDQQ